MPIGSHALGRGAGSIVYHELGASGGSSFLDCCLSRLFFTCSLVCVCSWSRTLGQCRARLAPPPTNCSTHSRG